MMDSPYLKAHRAASSLRAKNGGTTGAGVIGRTKDGPNSTLYTVTDAKGRPLMFSIRLFSPMFRRYSVAAEPRWGLKSGPLPASVYHAGSRTR